MTAIVQVLFHAAQHLEQNSLLDILVPKDRRREGERKHLKDILLFAEFLDLNDIGIRHDESVDTLAQLFYIIS
jgi:hypothetical protein